jgi:hypothetical protein
VDGQGNWKNGKDGWDLMNQLRKRKYGNNKLSGTCSSFARETIAAALLFELLLNAAKL